MARSWNFLVAIIILRSIGFSMPDTDVFKKLIPEFIFCFDFVNLRSNQDLVEIMTDFPHRVKTRQQRCFLRCVLRRHKVFLEPFGTLWSWYNAFEFLMSFGYSPGREPYVKSSLFFCVRKKKMLLSKYGCKNADNFFKCLTRHGMSFRGNAEFWQLRKQYLKENPYGARDMNQVTDAKNVTYVTPTRKLRGHVTLDQILYDAPTATASEDTVATTGQPNFGYTEANTHLTEAAVSLQGNDEGYGSKGADDDGGTHDEDDGDEGGNSNVDHEAYDDPSEPYRSVAMGANFGQRFAPNAERTTIVVKIPHIASRANKLSLKWVDMTNSG